MTTFQARPTSAAQPPSTSRQQQSPRSPQCLSAYTIQGVIGTGSFGRVSKIQRNVDGCILVMKELHYGGMNEKEKQQLVQEVNILRELQHPHIVRYCDRIIDRETKVIYIIMEWCGGGDLTAVIKQAQRSGTLIAETDIWRYVTQICQALSVCHTSQNRSGSVILHRDLKPGNIFLDSDNNVKLGDFGLARVLGEGSIYAQTTVGTPYYMSPEQVSESSYNAKSDVWSLGCLTYELCTLKPPFNANSHLALAVKIQAGKYPAINAQYSKELQQVIDSMLQVESHRRPSIEQLLQHPRIARTLRSLQQLATATPTITPAAATTANSATLDKQRQDLQKRERELEQRERAVSLREQQLARREAELADRELRIAQQERPSTAAKPTFQRITPLSAADEHQPSNRRVTLPSRVGMRDATNLLPTAAAAQVHIAAMKRATLTSAMQNADLNTISDKENVTR